MTTFTLKAERTYDLPPGRLWQVIADLEGYADHVSGLTATTVLSGDDLGAVRQCTTTKDDSWTERVTNWEAGTTYTLTVDTETYPFPLRQLFRSFQGTWTVVPTESGSRVTIHFEAGVRGGPLMVPLLHLMARSTRQDLENTLTSYGHAAAAI